ncbi:MAG TPA: hypothetical protein VKV06_07340 [Acidimicrobiales bacterium]|nr:hypothetical protein [Acidimicrobiales bacterium]
MRVRSSGAPGDLVGPGSDGAVWTGRVTEASGSGDVSRTSGPTSGTRAAEVP